MKPITMADIQANFRRDMTYLWREGVDSKHQLRDAVRIYTMGVFAALMITDDKANGESLLDAYRPMTAESWFPGPEWQWWETLPLPSLN